MESHENHLEWVGTRIKLASLEVLGSGNGTSGFTTTGCGVSMVEDGGSTVLFGVEVAIRLPLGDDTEYFFSFFRVLILNNY